MFTSEQISWLKDMPKHKELKYTDFMELAAERWKQLSDKEKWKYYNLADKDMERYEREMTEFKEKGYFTLPNGEKSQPEQSLEDLNRELNNDPNPV